MKNLWAELRIFVAEKLLSWAFDIAPAMNGFYAPFYKKTGTMPTDEVIDQEVEDWKKNLKWKRAIRHDDIKALRMIVKRLSKSHLVQ